jgi:hypothetical protein
MAPYGALSQSASPALVSERLTDLLLCFPAAAIGGVQWVTLVRKYEEKYSAKLDLKALGYESALTAASALLWDVVRIVGAEDTDNPVLVIEDTVALTARPGFLATWPSLYEALLEIVCNYGTLQTSMDASSSSNAHTIFLSRVKPLLQRHWHNNFDDCGLVYYTEQGSTMKLKKMKHLLNALFRWRADRLAFRASMGAPASGLSGIDAAIAIVLDIEPSESHNDILLRSFALKDVPKSVLDNSTSKVEVSCHRQLGVALPQTEVSTPCAGNNSAMQHEIERLRAENALLRSETNAALKTNMFDKTATLQIPLFMEDVFDDPSEPPPAMWTPSTPSTRLSSATDSGITTPRTGVSFTGSCTSMPLAGNRGVSLMPVWFPAAFGDRVRIPNGIVQQACAVFEQQTTIPSYFSQHIR